MNRPPKSADTAGVPRPPMSTRRAAMRFLLPAVGLSLLAPAAALARGYMTSGFRGMKTRPMTVAVLPPHAEFIKSKVVMTDQMVAESAALEREAGVALRTNLEVLGYKVRLLTPQDLEKDARLRTLVVKVNDRFAEEWGKIVYRPKAVKQDRYSCGDDAVRLATLLKVDGLAVARVIAVAETKGKAVLTGFMSLGAPPQRTYGRVDVGILSGRAGRIEGFFTGTEATSLGQLINKPAKVMGQATETALSRYPASTEKDDMPEDIPLPASEKTGKNGAPPDDEAAIKDFEVLIKGSAASGAAKPATQPSTASAGKD
jgi:hypothetical protein